MTEHNTQLRITPVSAIGQRFDVVAADLFPNYSRVQLKNWIKSGALTLDGQGAKPNTRLVGGERVELYTKPESDGEWQPEAMDLNVAYEDAEILVINKPAGLVVHPAAGNSDGTLVNGLLHRLPELQQMPRAGIVHRLDKDTTGLMVVAKTLTAQNHLVTQLQARSVSREYLAVVHGRCPLQGEIEAAIGRDPRNRKKMAVVEEGGKEARTRFQVVQRLGDCSVVQLQLDTGRTHQIRVHMMHLGYPLVGDPVYGKRLRKKSVPAELREILGNFPRQALHAQRLGLIHPGTKEPLSWQAEVPEDMMQLLAQLK